MDKKYAIIRLFIALCLVFMSGQSLATSPPKSPAKANDAGALSIDLTVIQASKTGAILSTQALSVLGAVVFALIFPCSADMTTTSSSINAASLECTLCALLLQKWCALF